MSSSNVYCCVPLCKQKGNFDPQGNRVGFFSFPADQNIRKQWLQKIRRDVGRNFSLTKNTRVCSLHFCKEEIRTGLSGKKMNLAKDAIPSKFAWRTSPRKRPPPSNRSNEVPEKGKRLEGLFTSEEDENVIEDPSLQTAYTNTLGKGFASTADDVVSNELDADELQESRESLKLQLLEARKETARLNQELNVFGDT